VGFFIVLLCFVFKVNFSQDFLGNLALESIHDTEKKVFEKLFSIYFHQICKIHILKLLIFTKSYLQ